MNPYQTTGGTCPKCGMPYTTGGCGCPLFKATTPTYGQMGWICPVCGRVLSPFTQQCPCRTPPLVVTCETGPKL